MRLRWVRSLSLIGLAGVLAGSGCSSNERPPPDQLVGNWILRNSGNAFGVGATFDSDGSYAIHRVKFVSAASVQNQIDDQLIIGSYVATDTQLTLTPTQSTCALRASASALPYTVTESRMTFTSDAGTTTPETFRFVRDTTPPSTAGGILGCFSGDESSVFTPSPLQPVGDG